MFTTMSRMPLWLDIYDNMRYIRGEVGYMKLIKWLIYVGLLQLVFTYCGPHWVIGGLLCSLISSNLKPSNSVIAESEPVHQLSTDSKL